ncbi:MAG: glutamate--tRNA ligase [Myxococcota bacterium]|jgi:glutamyl-tRNA synthetase|nr:glutamate--tRNA ligase [Myxococcota bacterium]
MTDLRTRFAPSPTGFLHLGSARTALYNWAHARRHGGCFVLRIEDTDLERSTRESEETVLDGLRWLGLDWDEGPHRQTERRERHREAIDGLLDADRAYRCTCSREELEVRKEEDIAAGGPGTYDGRCRDLNLGPDCGAHTVRLRVPDEGLLGWDDAVFGPSGQDARQIGDAIIQRGDGTPLYNLAVVVDDIDMAISHVIRGADHHPNTPLQIAIYRALEAPLPIFAHLPLIVGESGKKLSKRRDNVSIQDFRADGHLPEALVNWLVRLGWSHGDDEIFSLTEIGELFSLENVGRSPARAEPPKLAWLGQHYIKALPSDELFTRVRPYLEGVKGAAVEDDKSLRALLELLRERSRTLVEMAELARWNLCEDLEYDEKAVKKHLRPAALPVLQALQSAMEGLPEWALVDLEKAFEAVAAELGDLKLGKLAQPVRVAITGGPNSPGIFETLEILGRERTLARIDKAIEIVEARVESAD